MTKYKGTLNQKLLKTNKRNMYNIKDIYEKVAFTTDKGFRMLKFIPNHKQFGNQ